MFAYHRVTGELLKWRALPGCRLTNAGLASWVTAGPLYALRTLAVACLEKTVLVPIDRVLNINVMLLQKDWVDSGDRM